MIRYVIIAAHNFAFCSLRVPLFYSISDTLYAVASWNTQMVVMMDGNDTEFGPQVVTALFGYLIGVTCVVSSFTFGRHVFEWLRSCHPLPQAASIEEGITAETSEDSALQVNSSTDGSQWNLLRINKHSPIVAVTGLLSAFAFGDAVEGSLFHRKIRKAPVSPKRSRKSSRTIPLSENSRQSRLSIPAKRNAAVALT